MRGHYRVAVRGGHFPFANTRSLATVARCQLTLHNGYEITFSHTFDGKKRLGVNIR